MGWWVVKNEMSLRVHCADQEAHSCDLRGAARNLRDVRHGLNKLKASAAAFPPEAVPPRLKTKSWTRGASPGTSTVALSFSTPKLHFGALGGSRKSSSEECRSSDLALSVRLEKYGKRDAKERLVLLCEAMVIY